jgi:ribonuclease P protein component
MLPRSRRVSIKLFGEIMKKGTSYHSPHFSLKIKAGFPGASAFTVVVPKKVEKTAARRNRIKRRAMAIIRMTKDLPEGRAGIFFAKSGSYDLKTLEYKNELASLFKKI